MTDEPRLSLRDRIRQAKAAVPPPMPACSGRGIVICAGGARLFTCAWVLIGLLRRTLHCRLPIEVWHIGAPELGPSMRSLLEAFDVEVIDALAVAQHHPVGALGGWQLKTYALLHSRFHDVILLDADNLPVVDPAALFDMPEFGSTGAVFWPDIVRLKPSNPIWALAALPPEQGPAFETGQIVLDKARHWRALCLAHWFNQEHVAFEDMFYGDKDAFFIAWRLAEASFHLIRHTPKLLQGTFCQRAPSGAILFQHRNALKWVLNGANPRIEGFRWEDECFALLSELRLRWDGRVFNPPERSIEACAIEKELAETGRFRMIWVGSHEYDIVLHRRHLIEGGGAEAERYWFVADGRHGPDLNLVAEGTVRAALQRDPDGVWRGIRGGCPIELRPVEPAGSHERPSARQTAVALIATALLDGAASLSADRWPDHVTTLATLAGLDPALQRRLQSLADGSPAAGARAALAHAAHARHAAALPPPARPGRGTGWQQRSGNLDVQTDAVARP